jgi:hypothetical protein
VNSDLEGETSPLDPGLDQLFRTLTSGPAPGELAGEQSALAMFRENARPSAGPAADRGRFRRPSWLSRKAAGPVRWGVRLAAAGALVMGGAVAAAAYTAVLPAPVQHFAYQMFRFAGVPDVNHGHSSSSSNGSHHSASGKPTSPGRSGPKPSGPASTQPSGHASPTTSAGAGQPQLSATAAASKISAGSEAVVDGQLTRSGRGVAGVTVTLLERPARQATWQVAGTAQTNSSGNVAVSVSALATNAAFRLTASGSSSAIVTVKVIPLTTAELTLGAGGVADELVVSTLDAQAGNVVVLQVESSSGSWVNLRGRLLNSSGETQFAVSGKRLKNQVLRVVLLGTFRHAASVSNLVTVPPPS